MKVTGEFLKYTKRMAIPDAFVKQAKIEEFRDQALKATIYDLWNFVISEKLNEVIEYVEWPKTWWDMFKRDKLPFWIKKHLKPIQYQTRKVVLRRVANYPNCKLALHPDMGNPVITFTKETYDLD